jgi:predicted alternative tryptophan synthase beta-subunit
MPNTANQNPANKVGRNSGAGPSGITEAVPSAAEAARGLQSVRTENGSGGRGGKVAGAAALLGTGLAIWLTRRARRPRGRVERLRNWAGL